MMPMNKHGEMINVGDEIRYISKDGCFCSGQVRKISIKFERKWNRKTKNYDKCIKTKVHLLSVAISRFEEVVILKKYEGENGTQG